MSADTELHDATACLRWVLSQDGTAAALGHERRLEQRCAALYALVGTRVWTPRIPDAANYRNLTAAVWFAEMAGAGVDEHGEDTERSYEITALGGTTTGTAAGLYAPRQAEAVARAVSAVLGVAAGTVTPYGVIVSCVPETGLEFGFEEGIGWPWWKQVWSITTGAE